jgi:hypothetical protein
VTALADDGWLVTWASVGQDGAGGGIDILRMIEAGTLDLNAPALLTGIELVQGSSGNDVIITNTARLTDIVGLQGGGGFDELRLEEH